MSDKLLMPSTITADCKVVYRIGPEQTLAGLNTTTDYALHIGATSGLKKIISSVEAVPQAFTLHSPVQTSKNQ